MTQTATVNYHVHKPERQAFELDAGGIVGNLILPELAPTQVNVVDVRACDKCAFKDQSVGFTHFTTAVESFGEDQVWTPTYDAELTRLLGTELHAKEVIIFDHSVRIEDTYSDCLPARNVHSDYSQIFAEKRLIDILCPENAD